MSEPKLISPLLDRFNMGDPISDRHGVRCCPALERYSDNRYIVKIISVPADPSKLEALLLSGAYPDKEAALSYYSMLAGDIMEEAKLLDKLSQLDGFLSFDGCQIEPMSDGNGFDVYLLSAYSMTLQKRLRSGTLTHLEALNLGLDLCAALSVARRSGYLYADLKPGNIFIHPERGYRIGDLGFLKLDALKYASLPERYRSAYTAPEITDAYSALNTTLDIYAVGLILYQVFNNGTLPFTGEAAPAETFPAPAFADYEMAEIILKACAPDPAERWQDPVELGKALVDYMQRNGAHDTPITPVTEAPAPAEPENVPEDPEEQPGAFEATAEDTQDETNDPENTESEEAATSEEAEVTEEELPEVTEESIFTEDEEGNLTFITDDNEEDETLPDAEEVQVPYNEVSDDTYDILQQADELIAHEAPEPVVQPEPVDVPIPPPIVLSDEPEEETKGESEETKKAEDAEETEESEESEEKSDEETPEEDGKTGEDEDTEETDKTIDADEDDDEQEDTAESDEEDDEDAPKKDKKHRWLPWVILGLILAILLTGGYLFYKLYYQQTIDSLSLKENKDGSVTVQITTDIDESKLSVVCKGDYGAKLTAPVENGIATFPADQLAAATKYTVQVEIDGFHGLTGETTATFTTPNQSEIKSLTAETGSEDGSIKLSFVTDDNSTERWSITYTADDGTFKETVFTGRSTTLTGFTIGKTYDFVLSAADGRRLTGATEVSYTASNLIIAKDLKVTACTEDSLTVEWSAPEGSTAEGWVAHCFNDANYEESVTVTETTVTFQIPDISASYTIEVTAVGMSISCEPVTIPASALRVTNFKAEPDSGDLNVTWDCSVPVPQGGWKLTYTIEGVATQEIICQENSAVISSAIPGVTYQFALQAADGSTSVGGNYTYDAPAAESFTGFGITMDDLSFRIGCPPSYTGWGRNTVSYRSDFSAGEKVGFVIENDGNLTRENTDVTSLFVIRNADGSFVASCSSVASWSDMWKWSYATLEVPSVPETSGSYTIEVYWDGMLVYTGTFTIR